MIEGLSLRTLIGGVVAAGLIATHFMAFKAGAARSDLRLANERTRAEATLATATKNALATQFSLQAKIDNIIEVKNAQIQTVTRQRDALAVSVRNRPTARDTTPAEVAPSGLGSTGAGLARGDAEFLIGYASDAAHLAVSLNTCLKAYESARELLGDPAP